MAEAQGDYAAAVGAAVITQAAKDAVTAVCAELLTFLPQEGVAGSMPPPDYCDIPIHTAEKLRAEIIAANAAVEAAAET